MVCRKIEGIMLKVDWQIYRRQVVLIVLDQRLGVKTVGGEEKEDKIIKVC